MTAPRAPRWPLTNALRLAAVALLLAVGAILTDNWLSFTLWVLSVVFVVFAGIQMAKNWNKR